jgi:starch synthase
MGLQSELRARSSALSGILNGVDYDEWDPRHDRFLSHHYSPHDMSGKAVLKQEIISKLNLKAGADTPIFGIVSRMAMQKGHDLLFESLPTLLEWRDFAFVVLGSGESKYEEFFERLQREHPGRVSFTRGYNNELSHLIEAASDMFVMPSLYEPCGLNQMYSLRYGTVPIVRKTGGLADSVVPYDPSNGHGTGIVFEHFNPEALEWAMNAALDLYSQPAHWARMVRNGMAQDFSWERQGALYVQLYEKLLNGQAPAV